MRIMNCARSPAASSPTSSHTASRVRSTAVRFDVQQAWQHSVEAGEKQLAAGLQNQCNCNDGIVLKYLAPNSTRNSFQQTPGGLERSVRWAHHALCPDP